MLEAANRRQHVPGMNKTWWILSDLILSDLANRYFSVAHELVAARCSGPSVNHSDDWFHRLSSFRPAGPCGTRPTGMTWTHHPQFRLTLIVGGLRRTQAPALTRPGMHGVSLLCWLNMQDGKINLKLNQSNLLNRLIMRLRVRERSCLRSVHLVKRLHCELYFIFIFEPGQPNSFPHNFSTHFTMERPIKDNCNKCGIRFSPSFHELI